MKQQAKLSVQNCYQGWMRVGRCPDSYKGSITRPSIFELAAEADETINFILRTQFNTPRQPAKKRKLLPAELENKKSIK